MSDQPTEPGGPYGEPDPTVVDALRSVTPPPHRFGFWADVEDRLSAEAPTGTVRLAPPPPPPSPVADVVALAEPRRRPFPRWPALAAAAVVVVAAIGVALTASRRGTEVETTSAASSLPVATTLAATTTLPAPVTTAPAPTAAVTTPKPTVAPTTSAPPTTIRSEVTATPDGLGPLKMGMTTKQATATGAVGPFEDPLDSGGQCGHAEPSGSYTAEDFGSLFVDGRLARLYIGAGSRIRTPEGIGTGSASSKLKAVAGTRTESPHPYGGGTNVDIMRGNVGYQFTVDQGKVTEWSVGTREGLALPEGCA